MVRMLGGGGVIARVSFAEPPDGGDDAVAASEGLLRFVTQLRPGIRAGTGSPAPRAERGHGAQVGIERARACTGQAAVRTPDSEQRDGEIAPGVAAHECGGVVALAQRDPHAVSELS